MTTYRIFPSTNGPATPVNYAGDLISAVGFGVAGGNIWLEGYWWWVCNLSGGGDGFQPTTPAKCALWSVTGDATGVLVPGSVVTSGTLTAGQWNYIPLSTPIQLAPSYDSNSSLDGSAYVAAIGCNGPFPDTANFWGGAGAGANGISNGPLFAYNGSQGGTFGTPYNNAQGLFSDAGSDPSVTFPAQTSNVDNFWVDVQVSNTAPAGYAGSYRLWPNKWDSNAATTGDTAVNYTVATEISLTAECTLDNIWYYSVAAATTLATRCDVWNISTGLPAASITSPSWKTMAGAAGAAGGGWLKAAFAGGTTLPAGDYRVSVFNSNGTSDANWSPKDAETDYWGETFTGVGSGGITWGPLSAPNWAGSSGGYIYNGSNAGATPPYNGGTAAHAQPPFGQLPGGTVDFPQLFAPVGGGTNQTQNYWVDLEVTPMAAAPQVPAFTASMSSM